MSKAKKLRLCVAAHPGNTTRMVSLVRGGALPAWIFAGALSGALLTDARAETGVCRVVNLDFTPGGISASAAGPEITPQMVAWIEKPTGEYVDTVYITAQTGRYGIGNRPGRFDFNSGPMWPYGRRTTVFPVWAQSHGMTFPRLEFQSGQDSDLSHMAGQSSRELHFCRPLDKDEAQWDAATCSSPSFTDKGVFGSSLSQYPPRTDVVPVAGTDSPSVEMFKSMNPFDAVSQATPRIGASTTINWAIPSSVPPGKYVLLMEVALEQDFNASYNPDTPGYGSPSVAYGSYGVPYRGQPSVVYRVEFEVSNDGETVASTNDYIGYGDPSSPKSLHPPDATITTDTPNSGALRLLMTSKNADMFRLRVSTKVERDVVAPDAPGQMLVSDPDAAGATIAFLAPGDDGTLGPVQGYEVRYRAGNAPISNANFAEANQVQFDGKVVEPGKMQHLQLKNLLPETEYTVAVRAFDNCNNVSQITTASFTTLPRKIGEVDACFVATAAYGSVLANDVEMLRRFRDNLLRRSVLGELAVETYYTFGPPVAGVVGESDLLRATARDLLGPIVARVRGTRW